MHRYSAAPPVRWPLLGLLLTSAACQATAEGLPLELPSPTTVSIVTTELPRGTVGVEYNAEVNAIGPAGAVYSWQLLGDVPPGLSLQANDQSRAFIIGTPAESGTFEVEVVATADGDSDQRQFSLTVAAEGDNPLVILTETLPTALVGQPYATTLVAQGGTPPYAWALQGDVAGLVLDPNGELTGVPVDAGNISLEIIVQDADGNTATRTLTLRVIPPEPLRIEGPSTVDARLGVPVSVDLLVSGGQGAVMWTLDSDGAPGLALSSPGERQTAYAGVPAQAGRFSVTLRVGDEAGSQATFTLEVVVQGSGEPLRFEGARLPPATVGIEYEATLTAEGGAGGYTWQVLGDAPDGLTLNPTGTPDTSLRGVPTDDAFYTFNVRVTDALGATAEGEVFIRVDARALTIVTTSLPDGIATASYRQPIVGAGGTGAYAWEVIGSLPPGLTIGELGTPATEVTGVLETAGNFSFAVRVTDLAGETFIRNLSIQVDPPPEELTILTTSVPDGAICLGYDAPLEAVGGAGGYNWVLSQGTLPPGVTLSPTRGPRVELSGAPTAVGTYRFTLTVSDNDNATRSLQVTLRVTALPDTARYLAFNGLITRAVPAQFFLADICGPTPAPPVDITPTNDNGQTTGSSRPQLSPDGSKLAFIGPVTSAPGPFTRARARLYVLDVTGTIGTPVSLIPTNAPEPLVTAFQWSPDSRKLAFRAQLRSPSSAPPELYSVDVSNPAQPAAIVQLSGSLVARSEVTREFHWSPDSTTVAYVSSERRAGTFEVFFGLPSRPGQPIPAVSLPPAGRSIDPNIVWRADSGGVFFRGDLDADDVFSLYHVALNGVRPGPLARVNPAPVSGGGIAPDRFWLSASGEWLAFIGDLTFANSQNVYAARVTGGNSGTAAPVVVNPPFARDRTIIEARWSPAGDALVIHGDLSQREVFELFYVSFANGAVGGPVRLNPTLPADGDVNSTPETEFWSADSNWVGFLADARRDEKLELYVVDLRIPPPWRAVRVSPSTNDDNLDAFRFEFAPDGSRIALLGDYATRDRFELWAVDLRRPTPEPAFRLHGNLPAGATIKLGREDTAWKADGSAIFFRGDLSRFREDELWMVDLTSEGRRPPARVNPQPRPGGDVSRFGFTP